ncbi:MAG: hypothetical protein ACOY37_01845 [Pseudomonadota bacterium]
MNRLLLATVLCATALPIAAGEREAEPTLVLTRTVQPRIAYRALPPEQNPVAASVSTFPSRVFHAAVENATAVIGDQLLGDTVGEREFEGGELHGPGAPGTALPLMFGSGREGAARTPIGPGATVRGAVSGATSGLAGLVGGVVGQTGPGGGP